MVKKWRCDIKICFAGAENSKFNKLLLDCKVPNILQSYWYLTKNGVPSQEQFEFMLLDSGGFTARMHNVTISVKEYGDFINKHKVALAINLDTNDVEETIKNQNFLRTYCPDSVIIPVYHMSDWMVGSKLLDQFIDEGYIYIALGGTSGVRVTKEQLHAFYAYCFSKTRDKIKLHGLGQTSRPILEKFPFYTVDSTSWLSMSRFGNSLNKDKQMNKMKSKTRHYLQNTEEEIYRWMEHEKIVTHLWEKRGVKWDDNVSYRTN